MYLDERRRKAQEYRGRTKYAGIPASEFVGKYGGAMPRSYPVTNSNQAIAALTYARHAPYSEGIRRAVYLRAKKRGWINPHTGRIRRNQY